MPPPKDPEKYQEYCIKMQNAIKSKFKDPIYKQKHKLAMQKRSQTPEWREKQRQIVLKRDPIKNQNFINACKNPSMKTREKMSVAAKKRAENPEWLKQNRIQEHSKDSSWVEKQRQNALNQHSDPIKKQNFIDAIQKRSQNQEWKNKISLSKKGKCNGNKNPNWKNGSSFEPYCPKFNESFKNRVRSFWNYKCGYCGITQKENNRKLNVHHIHYDKEVCCNDNLPLFIPLCQKCHGKTNGKRIDFIIIFEQIINTKYNGKSYYTKEEYEKL